MFPLCLYIHLLPPESVTRLSCLVCVMFVHSSPSDRIYDLTFLPYFRYAYKLISLYMDQWPDFSDFFSLCLYTHFPLPGSATSLLKWILQIYVVNYYFYNKPYTFWYLVHLVSFRIYLWKEKKKDKNCVFRKTSIIWDFDSLTPYIKLRRWQILYDFLGTWFYHS